MNDEAGSLALPVATAVWDPTTATLRGDNGEVIAEGVTEPDDLAGVLQNLFELDRPTAAAAAHASRGNQAWKLADGRQLLALAVPMRAGDGAMAGAPASPRSFALLPCSAPPGKEPIPTITAALERLGPELRLGPSLVFWRVDRHGRFTRVARDDRGALLSLEKLLVGHRLSETFATASDPMRASIAHLTRALRSRKPFHGIRLLVPAQSDVDGPTDWHVSGYPIHGAAGEYEGTVGVAIDDGFTRFLEAVPLPATLWEWNEAPRLLASNRAMRELTGLHQTELQGLTVPALMELTNAELDGTGHQTGLGRMNGARGRMRNARTGRVETRTAVIQQFVRPSGACALAFYVDSTETLDREQVGRARSFARVAASVAHDVGNTVTVLNGLLSCLVDSDRETRIELTEDMQETADRMQQLLTRLKRLSIGANEHEDFSGGEAQIEPATEIDRIVKRFGHSYPDLELDCRTEPVTEGQGSAQLRISPLDLERTVLNLLANAVAACGSDGRIRLSSHVRNVSPAGSQWEIVVEDSGPGFPEAAADMLLAFGTSNRGGSGLGLFQVNGLVRSLGGYIELGRSEELGGARVEISVPLS